MPVQSTSPQRFPARFSVLPELLAPLTVTPQNSTVDASTLLRAQTVVEELLANSIHHGYGGESDQPVWLAVAVDGPIVRVIYADEASPYDPLAELKQATPVINDQGEAKRIGGVGRELIRGLADASSYSRRDQRNELTLTFAPRT